MQASVGQNLRIYCHDGREFAVFPHGAKPGYQVLIRGGDGEQIRAFSKIKNMPDFFIRLGARPCNERTLEENERWVRGFLQHLGFAVKRIRLSELHLRVDVPYKFSRRELERVSGTGTRNSKVSATYHPGTPNEIEDFSNRGGEPKFVFDIYDKRQEQADSASPFWPLVWKAHAIPAETPITRVEIRAKRETLLSYGIDTIDALTAEAMLGIWHDATTKYFYLSDEPYQRRDRVQLNPKWARVAGCGKAFVPARIVATTGIEPHKHLDQAAGSLSSYIAVQGIKNDRMAIDATVNRVADVATRTFGLKWEDRLFDGIISEIGRRFAASVPDRDRVVAELREHLRPALQKKIGASGYGRMPGDGDSSVDGA